MAKATRNTFQIQARVFIDTSIEVPADKLEDALMHARTLKTTDFVEISGEHNDSRVVIDGVWQLNDGIGG